MTTFLDALRSKRDATKTELDTLLTDVKRSGRTALTVDEEVRSTGLVAAVKEYDERIADLEAQEARTTTAAATAVRVEGSGLARVGREAMTYRQGGEHSYLLDLVRRQQGDSLAADRLARHAREITVEQRANMNLTDGTGGEFVPPLWLIDKYVPLARAGRVVADLCNRQPLPPGTDKISLPTVATGSATAEQTPGTSVQKTDMTTSSISGDVVTIAGQQVFAMQLLDQSPGNFDEVVFGDLLSDLAVKVDTYVLTKTSIGLLNLANTIAITYTDASPTVVEAYPKVADAISQMATNRRLPPTAIAMHPRRWAWFLSALDSSNRPLVVPAAGGPANAVGVARGLGDFTAPVGTLHGLPVYVDGNIPTNQGAGTNEDVIFVFRGDDSWLYESAPRTRVLFETDADTLSVRLQVWEYLAFLTRYPKSVAKIGGTGLITPTF